MMYLNETCFPNSTLLSKQSIYTVVINQGFTLLTVNP
mgnify:CR=1 FL=1